jgi:hypothetical protein
MRCDALRYRVAANTRGSSKGLMNASWPSLTEWERSKLCAALALGCARATACAYVGVATLQFEAELAADEAFATAVARAEAEPEVRHMGNIHRAAQSEKNWRTSAWWLVQRARADAKRDAGSATAGHLAQLVDDMALAIVAEVPNANVQRRLIERLRRILAGEGANATAVVVDVPFRLVSPPDAAVDGDQETPPADGRDPEGAS